MMAPFQNSLFFYPINFTVLLKNLTVTSALDLFLAVLFTFVLACTHRLVAWAQREIEYKIPQKIEVKEHRCCQRAPSTALLLEKSGELRGLMMEQLTPSYSTTNKNSECLNIKTVEDKTETQNSTGSSDRPTTYNGIKFRLYHLGAAVLYTIQTLIFYILMLLVMKFSAWILIAGALGETCGYFFFSHDVTFPKTSQIVLDVRKQTTIKNQ